MSGRVSMPNRVIAVLEEHGPMTSRDIARELGVDLQAAQNAINGVRRRRTESVRLYICGHRRDEDGGRLYPRPIWAVGDAPDAKAPKKLGGAAYSKRWRERRAIRVASVFHIALSTRASMRDIEAMNETFRRSANER